MCSLNGWTSVRRRNGGSRAQGRAGLFTAWELLSSEGESWLARGWLLDAITTTTRGGLGIARDPVKRPGLEVDLGAYVTQDYEQIFQRRFDPQFGVGLSMSF